MEQKMIFPASERLITALSKSSSTLTIRMQRAAVRPQLPLHFEFAPGISMYSPTFFLFKADLYERLQNYSNTHHKKIDDRKLIFAATDENMTIPDDFSFVLNLPGSMGHPNGYLQGAEQASFYSENMDKAFILHIERLHLKFSLEGYAGLIKPNSSSGYPLFSTELAEKAALTLLMNRIWSKEASKYLKIKDPLVLFEELLKINWAPVFMVNRRLQHDNAKKKRVERTVYSELVYSDRGVYYKEESLRTLITNLATHLGVTFVKNYFLEGRGDWYNYADDEKDKQAKFTTMRVRTPFMGPHSNITFSVIAPTIQNPLIEQFTHIFEVGDRITLENRINTLAQKWGRVHFIALDFKHFEMSWPHFIQKRICEALDNLIPEPYNWYTTWYINSLVLMLARTAQDYNVSPLYTSKNFDTYDGIHSNYPETSLLCPLKTEGNLSGQAFVAFFNKVFGTFLIMWLLQRVLGKRCPIDLNFYTEDNDIQFVNNGDDNLLFFKNEIDAQKVLDNILEHPMLDTVELTVDLPSFNAMYIIEKKNETTNTYSYAAKPSIKNFIAKWVVPEYDYGVIKKGIAEYPNLGRHYRTMNFLSAGHCSDLVDILFDTFHEHYKSNLLDLFPLDEKEQSIMNNEMQSAEVEDVWKIFAYTDPSKFYWHPLAKNIPIEYLKKFCAVITPEQFKTFLLGGKIWLE